jgi:ribosomal protein L11 methyltransferase
MAAARVWPGTVLAADNDPVAVEVARANVAANGLAGRVACREAEGLDHPDLRAAAPFGLILANILRGPLIALAPEIAGALRPGGRAILAGLLTAQAGDVAAAYAAQGMTVAEREEIDGWTILCLRKT